MKKGVALNLGHTTGQVVEVVAHHRDHVVRTIQIDSPVVVTVTSRGVVGTAVDQVVGDGDAVIGLGTKDNVLTSDAGSGNVINPDEISVVKGDSITTPNVLRVDISDSDVPGPGQWGSQCKYRDGTTHWMMMFLAPLTIRIPFPLIPPAEPLPTRLLFELTVIPRTPALSLHHLVNT